MGLDQKDLSRMLETAIVAARLAGQRAMEEIRYVKATKKNKEELVTLADARCQQIIVDRIKETYPDHGFIAEEGGKEKLFKQPPRGTEPIWWVIDPIDGTNNFARGLLLFAVSIAAIYKGEPVVGVIFDPATDSMFTGVKGREAQLNGRRITASKDKIDKFSSIGLDSHLGRAVPAWARKLMLKTRFRSIGSTTLQLAYVAKGGLIAAIHPQPKLWDVAAATVICEAARAIATDWQGNKIFPRDLDKYEGQRLRIVAANKAVHTELLRLLQS